MTQYKKKIKTLPQKKKLKHKNISNEKDNIPKK